MSWDNDWLLFDNYVSWDVSRSRLVRQANQGHTVNLLCFPKYKDRLVLLLIRKRPWRRRIVPPTLLWNLILGNFHLPSASICWCTTGWIPLGYHLENNKPRQLSSSFHLVRERETILSVINESFNLCFALLQCIRWGLRKYSIPLWIHTHTHRKREKHPEC